MRFEQNPCSDTGDAAVLGLAHRAVPLAPAEDALDHLAALLRQAIALVPCRAPVDRASPPLAGLGQALVLRHMGRDVEDAQGRDMILRVIGLVRTEDYNRAAVSVAAPIGSSRTLEAARRSATALGGSIDALRSHRAFRAVAKVLEDRSHQLPKPCGRSPGSAGEAAIV